MALSWSSYGYELDKQKEALNLIVTTAKELCDNVPLSGGTEGVQLTGEAKAKVSGIVKKLADLGLEGAVKYESNEYEGVLQKILLQLSTSRLIVKWMSGETSKISSYCHLRHLVL